MNWSGEWFGCHPENANAKLEDRVPGLDATPSKVHTPLPDLPFPWRVSTTNFNYTDKRPGEVASILSAEDDEWHIATILNCPEWEKAADLLVTAVNERPKLLERIKRLEEATKALMDAGTYLLAVQANKNLVETANSKFTAALETARAALSE